MKLTLSTVLTALTRTLLHFMYQRHRSSLDRLVREWDNHLADTRYAEYQVAQALVAAKRTTKIVEATADGVISNTKAELASLPLYK